MFSKNVQIRNFMKIRPVGAELFHADRIVGQRTHMTKLIVAFRNFAKSPKTNEFKPYREIMAAYCKNNMGRIRTVRNKCTAMHSDRQLEGLGLAIVAAKEVLPFMAVH